MMDRRGREFSYSGMNNNQFDNYNDPYRLPYNYQYQPMMPAIHSHYQYLQSPSTSATAISTSNLGSNQAGNQEKDDECSSPEATETDSSAKRVYEKWSQEEQKLLVNLWAENFERIESKDSRKVWDEIANKINNTFKAQRSKRTTDKFQKKIKYLIDRYKKAKDWNAKQTGGNRRKSIFYDEIDEVLGCREIVALKHVEEAGSSSSITTSTNSESVNENSDEEGQNSPKEKEKRSARKKKRSRAIAEQEDEEERRLLRSAVAGLEAQRTGMDTFMENFNKIQTEQLSTMNTLVGALTKFLEKQ